MTKEGTFVYMWAAAESRSVQDISRRMECPAFAGGESFDRGATKPNHAEWSARPVSGSVTLDLAKDVADVVMNRPCSYRNRSADWAAVDWDPWIQTNSAPQEVRSDRSGPQPEAQSAGAWPLHLQLTTQTDIYGE